MDEKMEKHSPLTHVVVTAEAYNAAFDPANEVLGGAFMDGFREGWIYAEIDADGERYQEMAEEYAMAVDTAPGEAWDAHRAKFFAMLPLAAIPEVGAPIGGLKSPTRKALIEALTPSGDTKSAFIGEFHFEIQDADEDGEECRRRVVVPWTTVKEIMTAISAYALAATSEGSEG